MRFSVLRVLVLVCVCGLFAAASAQAQSLSFGIDGILHSTLNEPGPDGTPIQLGPLDSGWEDFNGVPSSEFEWGAITSYSASPDLPQVGSDLDKYGFALNGQLTGSDFGSRTYTYGGVWWLAAPGYGYDTFEDHLEAGWFFITAVYTEDWSQAALTGMLLPIDDVCQPAGWPEPVDWSSAGTGHFNGTFVSATNRIYGTVTAEAVPEPMSIILGAMGLSSIAGFRRLRRK